MKLTNAFRLLLLAASLVLSLTLYSCGGGSGDGDNNPLEPADAPIQGFSNDPVGDSLVDTITPDAVRPEDVEEDIDGGLVEMTRLEIVFYPDTTTNEANQILAEFGGEVVAAIGGYPAVVVAITNPGTLQALDSLVADIESRGSVEWVLKSIKDEINIIPENIDIRRVQAIANGQNADQMEDWKKLANHLAVRGPAAWNAEGAVRNDRRTSVIIRDYFGKGIGTLPGFQSIFDAVPAGQYPSSNNDYLISVEPTPLFCQSELTRDLPPCKIWTPKYVEHGHLILGIHAGKHNNSTATDAAFLSGMVRSGIKLTAIDHMTVSSATSGMLALIMASTQSLTNEGLVVESISLGGYCTGKTPSDDCKKISDLNKKVIERIRRVRSAGLENRLLTVVAAANRKATQPVRAETWSHWNAASLIPFWFDDDDNSYPALTNTLVVENARIKPGISGGAPYRVECTSASSNLGGHIAGIGSGLIFQATGPLPNSPTKIITDGGTSSATPQVSGLAAFMGAIDPSLSPQRVIDIIEATSLPVPTGTGNSKCTNVTDVNRANVIDAYAAVLALDSVNSLDPQDARVRMALLDVNRNVGDMLPDGKFDENDLAVWVDKVEYAVRDSDDGLPILDYGRYDLNGDGYTGGIGGTGRFDLDVSEVTEANAYSNGIRALELDEKFPNSDIFFDENNLTDLEIVCYYAYTNFYEGDRDERDSLLSDRDEPELNLCNPCDVSAQAASTGKGTGLLTARASAVGTCEFPEKIAFIRVVNNVTQIHTMNPDGSNQRNISNNNLVDREPSISADRSRIAFISNEEGSSNAEIFVMNADGTDRQRLTNNPGTDGSPAWSPDGTKIAYWSQNLAAGIVDIISMDADGTDKKNLTNAVDPNNLNAYPTWSPDGDQIAFASRRDDPTGARYEIYTMDADGSNQTRRTNDLDASDIEPNWSPDGSKILFTKGGAGLFTMAPDGTNQQQVTTDGSFHTSWSPDGNSIVFWLGALDEQEIYIINADGTGKRPLTNNNVQDQQPSWWP